MPISTRWYDDDHQVIILEFIGSWTWEELRQAQEVQAELANSVSHNIVALIEMSLTNTVPKGNVLALGRSTLNNIPENITLLILVNQSRLIEVFAELIIKMMPAWRNRMQFVNTIAEAQQLIINEAVKANTGDNRR